MSDDRRLSEAEVQGLLRRLEAGGHWSASFKRRLLLTALDALKAQPRWVRCSERLPDEDGESVLFTDGDLIFVGEFVAPDLWLAEDGGMYCTKIECVTHWLPLPPLPEEDA